jgi:hypothetical protein
MNITQIKQYIEEEISKGNEQPYRELYSYCVKIYKHMHKDKVKDWNNNYYNKIKIKGFNRNPARTQPKQQDTKQITKTINIWN